MDDSLENKFRLATIAPLDRRMKRKHLAVYGFILDWYHRKYGDALASVRHIVATLKERDPDGIGLYTGDVHSALRDLVDWGYLTQEKGSGRRASRYVPDWAHGRSVHKTPNTTEDEVSVRGNQNTIVRENQNTTVDSVRELQNEDPFTGPGLQTEVRVSGNMFEAAPTAPPAVGLAATAAEPASGKGDGFSEFWAAWPRKHGKKKAQAEWKKIIHDVDIIIEAARIWADHYALHGVEKKWIPEPANWLKAERWDEDLPLIHGDAKGAAIAKAKANAPAKTAPKAGNDNQAEDDEPEIPEFMIGSPTLWPVGGYWGEFVENDVIEESKQDRAAVMTFLVNTPGSNFGKRLVHKFYVDCFIQRAQDEGQKYLADICTAVGVHGVEDLDDLMFKPLHVVANGSRLSYSKINEAAA